MNRLTYVIVSFVFLFSQPIYAEDIRSLLFDADKTQCSNTFHNMSSVAKLACSATEFEMASYGVDLPYCPKNNDFTPLPATNPTGGIFVHYTSDNKNFLKELVRTISKEQPWVKINIVINNSKESMRSFKEDFKDFPEIANNKNVNMIPVSCDVNDVRWAQDSYQIGQLGSKSAIYKLPYDRGMDELAREIGEACGMPVIHHPQMSKAEVTASGSGAMGGNLEAMPGGFLIVGENMPPKMVNDLKRRGNDVLPLDTSFLGVGHVDELFSVAKTGENKCDFVLLSASPRKAYEILDMISIKNSNKANRKACKKLHKSKVDVYEDNGVWRDVEDVAQRTRGAQCFGISGSTVDDFLQIGGLRDKNISEYQSIIDENLKKLRTKFNESGCNPRVVEVPVIWDESGNAVLPNIVNGLPLAKNGREPGSFLAPKTFFKPFDNYVEKSLAVHRVKVTPVNDIAYHRLLGEVHCGTNSVQVCKRG